MNQRFPSVRALFRRPVIAAVVGGILLASLPVVDPMAVSTTTPEIFWSERANLSISPPARQWAAMTYDGRNSNVVMFGGQTSGDGGALDDTWIWDGSSWQSRTPAGSSLSPSARYGAGMAYDRERGEVVLFGGWKQGGNGALNDTWTWDGIRWTNKRPDGDTTSPPKDGYAMLTYDGTRDNTVLVGKDPVSNATTTWTWNGSLWTQKSPTTVPTSLHNPVLVYDPVHAYTVLSGWNSAYNTMETWTWNGNDWTRRLPPTDRANSTSVLAAAYDPDISSVVVFGGYFGTARDDTWAWDGQHWNEVTTSTRPSGRYAASMAYDEARRTLVLFGGVGLPGPIYRNDTWTGSTVPNAAPTLTITGEPGYENDGVDPLEGPASTAFTYRVKVTDDGPSLSYVKVYLNRESTGRVMEKLYGDPATGAVYQYTTTRGLGNGSYYFEARDSANAVGRTSEWGGPNVYACPGDGDCDGLTDADETNLTHTRIDTVDTDGDGLWDSWEAPPNVPGNGYRIDGVTLSADTVLGPFGGLCPVPDYMGRWTNPTSCLNDRPDPLRKDVYLELDWQDCREGYCPGDGGVYKADTLHHAPHGQALREVRDLFGQAGIGLHIQLDENIVHKPNCITPNYLYYETEQPPHYPPLAQEHFYGTKGQRDPDYSTWIAIRKAKLRSVRYIFSGHSARDMENLSEPHCPAPTLWEAGTDDLPNYDLSPLGMVAQGGNLIVISLGPLWLCGSLDPNGADGGLGQNFGRCLNEDWDVGIFPAQIESRPYNHPVHLMLGEREKHAAQQLWARSLARELGKALGLNGGEAKNDPMLPGVRGPSYGYRTPHPVEPYTRWNLNFALRYPVNPFGPNEREPLPDYWWLEHQDPDDDGVLTWDDNCPSVWNETQADSDDDDWGDACDRNIDGDGQPNQTPEDDEGMSATSETNYDPYPYDTNNDGEDNHVDPDDDGDGVVDSADNCVLTANTNQADLDTDAVGDSCDRDADGDGLDRGVEEFAHSDALNVTSVPEYVGYASSCSNGVDDDRDGAADSADSRCADDDGDGYANVDDLCPSLNDLRNGDEDDDGIGDPCDLAVSADGVSPPRLGSADASFTVLFDTTAATSFQLRLGGTSCSTGQVLASGSPPNGGITLAAAVLPEGASTLRICATAGGETVGDTTTVVRDLHAPVVVPPVLVSGTDAGTSLSDGVTNAVEPILGGTTEPDANVVVYEGVRVIGRPRADASGAWTLPLTGRSGGTYAFKAMAYDDAGNMGVMSSTATIILDLAAPTSTINPPPIVLVQTQTVSGTTTDNLAGVQEIVVTFTPTVGPGAVETFSPTPVCAADRRSCTWSVPVPLVPGNYNVDVETLDIAGNVEVNGPTSTVLIG